MYQIGQDLGVFLEMLNFQKFRVCPLLEKYERSKNVLYYKTKERETLPTMNRSKILF